LAAFAILAVSIAAGCNCNGGGDGAVNPKPGSGSDATGGGPNEGAGSKPLTERQKMDLLVEAVATSDITFMRRGSAYKSKAAADHIRYKMSKVETRLAKATAREFIDDLASVSWGIFGTDRKPYHVKLADGRIVTAKEWLYARLAEIEAAHPGRAASSAKEEGQAKRGS